MSNGGFINGTDSGGRKVELGVDGNNSGIVAHFRLGESYEGEYGFDWIREEWYDKNTFPDLYDNDGNLLLEKESTYEVDDSEGEKYNIPTLAMYENHKERIGKDVVLNLKIIIQNKYWLKKGIIEFRCPDGVTVDNASIELKICKQEEIEGGKLWHLTTPITLTCSKKHSGGYIVADLSDAEKNIKKRRQGGVVGRLKLLANNKTTPLKVRLVSFIRQSKEAEDRAFFENRLKKIEFYLKNRSFNQGFIDVEVENKEVVFDDVLLVNEGYINETQFNETIGKEKVFKDAGEGNSAFDKIVGLCEDRSFKGIITVLSPLKNESGGVFGVAYYSNVYDNICLIYKDGVEGKEYKRLWTQKYFPTLAHEMGHVLSLDHTFENYLMEKSNIKRIIEVSKTNLEVINHNIDVNKHNIIIFNNLIASGTSSQKNDAHKDKIAAENDLTRLETAKKIEKEHLKEYEDSYPFLLNNPHYKFPQSDTDNIMDYTTIYGKKGGALSFFDWQVDIMRKHIKDFTK